MHPVEPDGTSANPSALLQAVREVACLGGREALRHYGGPVEVEYKADASPLTLADKASHEAISEALRDLAPSLPVLSEESAEVDVPTRLGWQRFWLVDPVDGTKEFLKKSGEFTVNIALVEDGRPVLGIVYVPVTGLGYLAERGRGAWVQEGDAPARSIRVRRADIERLVVVASRDHSGPEVEALLGRLRPVERTSMGSALKFCLVAEGKADFYPRLLPTMEWDTAAAQCVVEAAGGQVLDLDGRPLSYNKPDLRNPPFLACGDPSVDWAGLARKGRERA
jgi:3'(2'), 5'-bisphosphate nucleotidase